MPQVPMEELLKRCRSVYKLVTVASRRAKELSEGSPRLIEGDLKKITTVALEEIRQGKVLCKLDEENAEGKGKPRAKSKASSKKK